MAKLICETKRDPGGPGLLTKFRRETGESFASIIHPADHYLLGRATVYAKQAGVDGPRSFESMEEALAFVDGLAAEHGLERVG